MNPSSDIIVATHLIKRFGVLAAVDNIDFRVGPQECFGFLGPNGAGKTTTVRMVSCFMAPTSGVLSVLGLDASREPRRIKARLGVCPQENNLDPDLTVLDNLRVFARYFDIPASTAVRRADELLHFVGLFSKRRAMIDELSGGMKRRLILARSLLNDPDLLVLDEPTTGLDPQARHQIWETVIQLKRQGTTVALTTHYMDEAAHLCDRIVIMDHGRILLEGRPRDLVRAHVGGQILEIDSADPAVAHYLAQKGWPFERSATHYFVNVREGEAAFKECTERWGEGACVLRSANLEDVFLKATGRALRE
jgi:lipooligosaccharide transport system ATP-binding protein